MAYKEWQFKKEDGSIPVGAHRIRIAEVENTVSKAGNDMIKLVFDVSGSMFQLWYFIVFMPESPEFTNRLLTQLFDSFEIEYDNFNFSEWVGKVGACMVKLDDEGRAKVSYMLHKNKQGELPAWKEPTKFPKVAGFTEDKGAEDIPF